MSLSLRVRHPQGVSSISVDPDSSIDRLLEAIASVSGISADSLDVKYGYPPKPLELASRSSTAISSLSLAKNEQLVVSLSASRSAASTPSTNNGTSERSSTTSTSNGSRIEGLFGSSSTSTGAGPTASLGTGASAASANSASTAKSAGGGDWVQIEGGYLVLQVVPDDNSCLFSAIAAVFEGGIDKAQEMRKIVARAIESDPETYSELFLERPPKDYVRTILTPQSWGGAIELSIFAQHYKTEISSIDVATGRIDRFGEGKYTERCVLIYSGIHYDLALLSPTSTITDLGFCQTTFSITEGLIFHAAKELAAKLKARHYYTDTARFDLRCGVCKVGLKGEKEAREHAKKTGHVEFGEY